MSLNLKYELGQRLGKAVAQTVTEATQTQAPKGTESQVANMFAKMTRRTATTIREAVSGAGAKTKRREAMREQTWLDI